MKDEYHCYQLPLGPKPLTLRKPSRAPWLIYSVTIIKVLPVPRDGEHTLSCLLPSVCSPNLGSSLAKTARNKLPQSCHPDAQSRILYAKEQRRRYL